VKRQVGLQLIGEGLTTKTKTGECLMRISAEKSQNCTIINIDGAIAANDTVEVKQFFDAAMAEPDSAGIIIDCKKVTNIDSSGLNLIVSIYKTLTKQSQKLVLCTVNEKVMEIFLLTKLDEILTFTESQQSALTHLAADG